ncbi:MAG TPA: FAD-dependent oxidoreductase [Burkholderiales bacterium]
MTGSARSAPSRARPSDGAATIPSSPDASAPALVLVGGGHSHVEVLRRFANSPPPAVRLTLASPGRYTPYSGMLPGLIAGIYRFEDAHIDLALLARRAGAEFIEAGAVRLDTDRRILELDNGRALSYDTLSINTGSQPDLSRIPGARAHGVPVKPVDGFLKAWDTLRRRGRDEDLNICVVGAGAAGVEVTMAMHHAMEGRGRYRLVSDMPQILPGHSNGVRRAVERILRRRGVELQTGRPVAAAEPGGLRLAGGMFIPADAVIWTVGAAPPPWIAHSGLTTDPRGFVAVDRQLRSLSHPEIFAAGDSATLLCAPTPKSGVYAVRQGPLLALNLRRALAGEPLAQFRPQHRTLALISAGGRYAVASYGPLALEGGWVWRWKDWIDRRFMARYREE